MKVVVLKNSHSEVHFSPFGAAIMKWIVKDSLVGELDIVLGLENVQDYESSHPSFGSIVGRCANRINQAKFRLNEDVYKLDANIGIHHLHGGIDNYAFKKWDILKEETNTCTFGYCSPHMESNYPGKLEIEVSYNLLEDNTLRIVINAITDKDTIVNMTNHAYFNLNGHNSGTILDHTYQINATHFTPTNSGSIPSGVIQSVKNTKMDLRTPQKLNRNDFGVFPFIETKGHDHNYVLVQKTSEPASIVSSDRSGLKLQCYTNQPGMQLYLGNWLDGLVGKGNTLYQDYQGFCLEAQAFPDSINNFHFPTVILRKGESYYHETSYKVSSH